LPTQASAIEAVGAHTGIVSMCPLGVLAGAEQSTDRWLTGRNPVYLRAPLRTLTRNRMLPRRQSAPGFVQVAGCAPPGDTLTVSELYRSCRDLADSATCSTS